MGIFIGLIGLQIAGVVRTSDGRLSGFGDATSPSALAAYIGLGTALVLDRLGGRSFAALGGMGVAALYLAGRGVISDAGRFDKSAGLSALFHFDLGIVTDPRAWSVVLVLFALDFFGSIAKVVGLSNDNPLLDGAGRVPGMRQALLTDSGATMAGSAVGSSSFVVFVESAVSVRAGARTGIAAVVTGVLLLACLVLGPVLPDRQHCHPVPQPRLTPVQETTVTYDDVPTLAESVQQPDGVPERLHQQIDFILEVDRLKTILRRSPLLAADRRENDAEHSWHLALMTLVLAEYADEPVDVSKVLALVLVHDLVEIYAGDTFLYDAVGAADQEEREQEAADRLFALLPDDQRDRFRALWDEFEARKTPEARFAKAMDRLQPLLLNFANRGGTWRTPGVTEVDVRARKSVIGDASAPLWQYAQNLIDTGAENGWVARAEGPT